MAVSICLIARWGASLTAWTRRVEREKEFPTLTYTQLVCVAVATVDVLPLAMVWAVASYRPADTSPDITRTLNDFAWFLFLFAWPPFSIWCLALACAIFGDRSETFPRWVGYLSVWSAILFVPAGLIVFFKTGAFSYDGLIAMYMVTVVFLIWVLVMAWAMLSAIGRHLPATAAGNAVAPASQRSPTPVGVAWETP
jgi:hypothetical protein